ncbi:MAG: hypothetical protein H0X50_12340 [Nitrosopumilus sp.]|nr:hypothetical protein [Nitrosopumilus sp.]
MGTFLDSVNSYKTFIGFFQHLFNVASKLAMVQKVCGVLTFDDSSEVGACAVGFERKESWRWY